MPSHNRYGKSDKWPPGMKGKLPKQEGVWKCNLPYIKNYMKKSRGYLVNVQVKKVG